MSITINSGWTTVANDTVSNNKINQQLNKNIDKADDRELIEACKQFEAYFVEQIFKQMKKTVPESSLIPKSQGEQMYEDMLYQEYAQESVKGEGIGLAQMLYKQMSKKSL